MTERLAVVGLGYVGLTVAVSFAKKYQNVVGFDIDSDKIASLTGGIDRTGEVSTDELAAASIVFTAEPSLLKECSFFIVAVPTPIDCENRPDLTPLVSASKTVGRSLGPGSIVVYESTVYPGLTEEICAPILERESGLKRGTDFKVGYSPERINPGDRQRPFHSIKKIVSSEDNDSLERIAAVYESVVTAGVHRAKSIRVAEMAKVIENTQRDVNIALMNELAIICDRLGMRTKDVIDAAATKWNFMPFLPGLVGGHCIGVDPYYLASKAQEVGVEPRLILAGRRINDGMGCFLARRLFELMEESGTRTVAGARVGVLGLTFKENVPDLRNSRVPELITGLQDEGVEVVVHDPFAEPEAALLEYGIQLSGMDEFYALDGLVVAVGHRMYRQAPPASLASYLRSGGVLMDVKSIVDSAGLPEDIRYWSL